MAKLMLSLFVSNTRNIKPGAIKLNKRISLDRRKKNSEWKLGLFSYHLGLPVFILIGCWGIQSGEVTFHKAAGYQGKESCIHDS